MRSSFTRKLAFVSLALAGHALPAADLPPPAAIGPSDKGIMVIADREVHLPGFRKAIEYQIDGNAFAVPKQRDGDDYLGVLGGLRERIEGVRIDPVAGDAVRLDGRSFTVGSTIEHTHAVARVNGNAGGESATETTSFTLAEVHQSYIVVNASDGTPLIVPLRSYSGASKELEGGTREGDFIVGTGVMIHPSGLVLTSIAPERDARGDAKPLSVHTHQGRFALKLVIDDKEHGVSLWQLQSPNPKRKFPFAQIAPVTSPQGSELTAVFYEPGTGGRQPGLVSAKARLPLIDSNGWISMRGSCPPSVMLFNAAGILEGVTLKNTARGVPGVRAIHTTCLRSIRAKVGGLESGAVGLMDEVVVGVGRPMSDVFGPDNRTAGEPAPGSARLN